ncbi:MAG: single-stranded DNA-binding protein [Flavobacteriales bacterium]|nr:single-stranded DNA-binding protein [Flavobacteriales bacterium]
MTTMKNKVQLVGRIGKDPELKTVGSGLAMLRMSIATNERFKAADGEWKDDTQWHPVVAWGKQAERLASSLRKGSGIVLEGRLMHRSYEAKDGSKRMSTEVVLSDYQLLAPKAEPVMAEADEQ